MKITGIIVEYNPLHNGHELHIKKSLEVTKAEGLIAVMSGNYVQRGEPALLDKWTRAQLAVESGVNLVLELPTAASLSSAEDFAASAIDLLAATGLVTDLVFGSESNDMAGLTEVATLLAKEPPAYQIALKEALSTGLSYPRAQEKALASVLGPKVLIPSSNDILGLAYLKRLLKKAYPITAHTIQRMKVGYHDEARYEQLASATGIRRFYKEKAWEDIQQTVPNHTYKALMKADKTLELDDYFPLFMHQIRLLGPHGLGQIKDVQEGLEHLLYKEALRAKDLSDFIEKVKSKRYTYTRIQRIMLQALFGLTKDNSHSLLKADTLRVLAHDQLGAKLLRTLQDQEAPVITTLSRAKDHPQVDFTQLADRLYYNLKGMESHYNYLKHPYKKKESK